VACSAVRRSPGHFQSPVHPLVRFAPLQSFHRPRRPPSPCSCSRKGRAQTVDFLPWGFRPLRDIAAARPHSRAIPGPTSFRPQGFSPSRRFAPRCSLKPCFMPQPRAGFHLQGFCSPPNDRAASRQPEPPRRFLPPSLREPKSSCQSDGPRPRGRAPSGVASACPRFYPLTGCAPLMVFLLFRALPSRRIRHRVSTARPALRFADDSFELTSPTALRSFALRRARFDSLEPLQPS
jgi:hypothetical protein